MENRNRSARKRNKNVRVKCCSCPEMIGAMLIKGPYFLILKRILGYSAKSLPNINDN